VGVVMGLPKFLGHPYRPYGAHRAVIFAIAQLPCIICGGSGRFGSMSLHELVGRVGSGQLKVSHVQLSRCVDGVWSVRL